MSFTNDNIQAARRAQLTVDPHARPHGKTHAIEEFLTSTDRVSAFITSSPSPTRKEIFEELLIELTGTVDDMSTTKLRRSCIEVLNDLRPVVAVDEAQHLKPLWLQQLRSLHDHGRCSWPLILVGGVGCEQTLRKSAELWSRVGYRVRFDRLRGSQLHAALRDSHPILANTSTEPLDRIDKRHGHGNWRNWLQLCQVAFPIMDDTRQKDRLTEQVVQAALMLIWGKRP